MPAGGGWDLTRVKGLRYLPFWDVIQRSMEVSYVFGQPVGPAFKGQAVQEDWPEKSAYKYQSTQRNIPEERRSHLQSRGNLKSRKQK